MYTYVHAHCSFMYTVQNNMRTLNDAIWKKNVYSSNIVQHTYTIHMYKYLVSKVMGGGGERET